MTNFPIELPAELISHVCEALPLTQLLTVMGVSRIWRAMARDQPIFWKDLKLLSTSPGALEMFAARLSAAGLHMTPISLHVDVTGIHDQRVIIDSSMPLILGYSARISRLELKLHPASYDSVISLLCEHPAPQLSDLMLHFTAVGELLCSPLPQNIFAQSSPKLTAVSLAGIRIAAQWPSSFEFVKHLAIDYGWESSPQPFPHDVVQSFPLLKALVLEAHSFRDVEPISSDISLGIAWGRLLLLSLIEWSWNDTAAPFIEWPSLKSIGLIRTMGRSATSAHSLLGHFDALFELTVTVKDTSSMAIVCLTRYEPYVVRHWIEDHTCYPANDRDRWMVHPVLLDPSLSERVRQVTIDVRCWYILANVIATFPQCIWFVLYWDPSSGPLLLKDLAKSGTLACPAIQTVMLFVSAQSDALPPVDELAQFVAVGLACDPHRVDLAIRTCIPVLELDRIPQDGSPFRSVQYLNDMETTPGIDRILEA